MRSTIAFTMAFFAGSGTALAYDVVEVRGGGEVAGVVTLTGRPPKPPAAASFPKDLAEADRKFCGGKEPLVPPLYVVGPAGQLRDVVVWLEGVAKGKALRKEPRSLMNQDCRFGPHVQSMDVGAELVVENRDPILHNTHPVYLGDGTTLFNVAMPERGQTLKKKAKRAGVLKVQCDAGHTWMRAFVHVFEHPYHAVTGADGTFRIGDVPAGNYTLTVWHEAAGTLSRAVEVTAGGKMKADLALVAK